MSMRIERSLWNLMLNWRVWIVSGGGCRGYGAALLARGSQQSFSPASIIHARALANNSRWRGFTSAMAMARH